MALPLAAEGVEAGAALAPELLPLLARLGPFFARFAPSIGRALESPVANFAVQNKRFLDPGLSYAASGGINNISRMLDSDPSNNPGIIDFLAPLFNYQMGRGYSHWPLGIGKNMSGMTQPFPEMLSKLSIPSRMANRNPFMGMGLPAMQAGNIAGRILPQFENGMKRYSPLGDTLMTAGASAGAGIATNLLYNGIGLLGSPPPQQQPMGVDQSSSQMGQPDLSQLTPQQKDQIIQYYLSQQQQQQG